MRRLLERAPTWLARPWVPWLAILLALLLVSPSLVPRIRAAAVLGGRKGE